LKPANRAPFVSRDRPPSSRGERSGLVAGEGGKVRGSNTTRLWASSIKSWNRKIHGPLLQAVQVGTDLGKQLVAVDLGVGCCLNLRHGC